MKITVWTVTTDGDDCALTTTVHGTLKGALNRVAGDLDEKEFLTIDDAVAAWEQANDGACCIEDHWVKIDMPKVDAVCADLVARAEQLEHSAHTADHKPAERNALLVAGSVLRVAAEQNGGPA